MPDSNNMELLVNVLTEEVTGLNRTVAARNKKQDETNKKVDTAKNRQWIAIGLVMVVFILGFFQTRVEHERLCKEVQQNRDFYGEVIRTAYKSQTSNFDITMLPHYKNLDPANKAMWDDFGNLIKLANSGHVPNDKNNNRVPDDVDALLKLRACP